MGLGEGGRRNTNPFNDPAPAVQQRQSAPTSIRDYDNFSGRYPALNYHRTQDPNAPRASPNRFRRFDDEASMRYTTPTPPSATARRFSSPYRGRSDNSGFNGYQSVQEFPIPRGMQDGSMATLIPEHHFGQGDPQQSPRGSFRSDYSLGTTAQSRGPSDKYTFSSYRHPNDIPPPENAYGTPSPRRRRGVSFVDESHNKELNDDLSELDDLERQEGLTVDEQEDRFDKRRSVLSHMIDLYTLEHPGERDPADALGLPRNPKSQGIEEDKKSVMSRHSSTGLPQVKDAPSHMSEQCQVLDPDDPVVTGKEKSFSEEHHEVSKNALQNMDYRQRRKYLQRVRIEFNVTSIINRQAFLLKLARALMSFGAPSHRIESQITAAARILEVQAEIIHLPSVIICSFGDQEIGVSETHFVKCGSRLSLGSLHKVHMIYRNVVHDEISAADASEQLDNLLSAPPVYPIYVRCLLAFALSALICPLAFGGSFLDLWISGAGALFLSLLQLCASKSALYANVFEITVAIIVSFAARGLSSIRSRIFCYTAISSAGIIGILPGYLILSSSLELASKNIVCGSVKMVYALIYTLFLGFGLQIGSDFYLLFDRASRHQLDDLAVKMSTTVSLTGTWMADNGTVNNSIPVVGTWTFTHAIPLSQQDIVDGCYRPKSFPWFLQPFPYWCAFFIVPVFSLLSSLANLQPLRSKQLPIMVVISCCSYASNKVANHYIFNRSDIVSAIGAFTVGLLGNIYSRKMGGTAFTSMVTGVLFLVPSGLSQAGGITANGNGIDIGGAMIAVTIGITVGLFMSQALVYMFGSRKNAAVFSF